MSVMKLNNSFTLSIMVALMFLTCTTGDRNNPLDPGNPDHIDKPVAYLRVSDTTIFINDTLVLTGSCENNEFLDYYIWRIGSKTETTESGNKNFVWKDSGKYVIEMRVIDKYKQKSEWVSCKVKVLTGQPTVTFDSSIFSTTIRDSITIIPYHYDENGTIKHYIWQYTSGKETLCDTTDTIPRKFVWKDFGKKVLSLRVIDDDNLVSHTAICTVLVGLGAVPTVSIISDTSCFINDTIKIKADGKDQNGTVEKYIWSWTGSKKEDTTTSSTNSFIWPDSGYKTVTVWAVDNDGQISKPDTCVVTVSSGAPIITKINDTVASTTMGCKIILNAKTDSRLSSDNVMWLWDTGAPGWDDSTSGKTHTFNQNSGGKLRVIWAAKVDGKALSIKDTFFITFNRPPEEPKLSLPDKDIAQWISISSSGKGSVEFKWEGSDPDSNTDISSFHFTLNTESGNNVFKYTGPDKFCTVSNLDTLKKYNWRLVSKDRFGDSAFAEGSITTSFGLPIIISQPQGITIAKGDSLKLHIGVAGRGTLSYQWKKDGVDISSKDSSYYLKKGASYSDSGYYKCIISNSSGSVTSDSVKVVVLPVKPKIIKHPVSDTVQRGSSAYFTITAEGDFLQYQWQKNGVDIATNGNSDKLNIDIATLADNGAVFRCIVSNAAGKDTSSIAVLTVKLAPPVIVTNPKAITVTEGGTARFDVVATGDSLKYQWQKDRINIEGENSDSLYIFNAAFEDSGNYRCIVWNSAGQDTSNEAELKVRALPKYTLSTSVMPSGGGSVTLSPSGGVYDSGTVVTLTASPTSEYNFLHWIDGNSIWTWTSLTVTMTGNKSIIAYFEVKKSKFTLTTSVQPTGGGSISLSPSGGTYDSGTVVTLTASPASGYNFSNWSGSAVGPNSSVTIPMTENKSVTANFSPITYNLTINSSAGGSTTPSGTITLNPGSSKSITATPSSSYFFNKWTVVSGTPTITNTSNASTTVSINGNATIKANFEKISGEIYEAYFDDEYDFDGDYYPSEFTLYFDPDVNDGCRIEAYFEVHKRPSPNGSWILVTTTDEVTVIGTNSFELALNLKGGLHGLWDYKIIMYNYDTDEIMDTYFLYEHLEESVLVDY